MRPDHWVFGWLSAWAMCVPTAALSQSAPCEAWVARLPGIQDQHCPTHALHASGHRSVRGQALWETDVSPLAPTADVPRVLVIGGVHGDELTSTSLALYWLTLARTQAQADSSTHWRFVPMLNPDGLLTRPPKRTNARGVDLNRNFPTPGWEKEARRYWENKTRKDPRRYPGPSAVSEPETRYIQHLIDNWKPQLIVSIHAPYGVLDFDSAPGKPTSPPSKLGKLYLQQVGVYPGSLGNYAGVHLGIPVVTVELPSAHRAPSAQEAQQMWTDLQRWMAQHLQPTAPKSQP